jgi:ribosomal protein S18 acetylase RimI-like enzyme
MPENDSIEIRRFLEPDAQAFYRLRLEALENEPNAYTESPDEHRQMTARALAKLGTDSADNSQIVLGACSDEEFIGLAGLGQLDAQKTRHKARLWGVYVKPEWRRKGVARVLVTELIRRARSMPGLEQITLSVADPESAAMQLFRSFGFEVYGHAVRALKVGDHYVDEELMVLHLKQ